MSTATTAMPAKLGTVIQTQAVLAARHPPVRDRAARAAMAATTLQADKVGPQGLAARQAGPEVRVTIRVTPGLTAQQDWSASTGMPAPAERTFLDRFRWYCAAVRQEEAGMPDWAAMAEEVAEVLAGKLV